ncbi:MAG: helix-turn-helix domain-containing protein [Alphaproteobacteria bacterium]|nr:helix-turn-helix domain-containing protein [Alphaproteobacteria bacterium]
MLDKWTHETVAEHFEEAIRTLKRLPPVRVQGYFNAWPNMVYSPNEIMMQEPMPMRLRATPDAISRLDMTFEWMPWITVEERKLIWQRAARVRWKTICWELGCDRTTAWRKWVLACTKIATRLNAQRG